MTALDMTGHIDGTFESVPATRTPDGGQRVAGKWQSAPGTPSPHTVTVQAATPKEIQNLGAGGERLNDVRRVYVNDGDLYSIRPSDLWTFEGIDGTFKAVAMDNRPWRGYCKLMVSRNDT